MKSTLCGRVFVTIAIVLVAACQSDIQSGVDSANDLLYQQKYVDAERLYQKLLSRLEDGGRLDDAGEHQHQHILERLGKINTLYLHDYKEAIENYEKLVRHYPKTPEAFAAQATVADIFHHKLGDLQRAINAYEKLISDHPRHEEARRAQLKISSAYYQLRNYEQARSEAEKVVHRYPSTEEASQARFQIANAYYVQERYAEAIATYEQLLQSLRQEEERIDKTRIALVLFELGNCYQEVDEPATALAYYYACLSDHPDPLLVQRKLKRVRDRARQVKPAPGIHVAGRSVLSSIARPAPKPIRPRSEPIVAPTPVPAPRPTPAPVEPTPAPEAVAPPEPALEVAPATPAPAEAAPETVDEPSEG